MKSFANKISRGTARRTPFSSAPFCGSQSTSRLEIQQILRYPQIQPKLVIGASNDACEREADQVADAVMEIPNGAVFSGPTGREDDTIRAKPASEGGEAEPTAGELPEEEEEALVSLKADVARGLPLPDDLDARVRALDGGGAPLGEGERAFFEPRFGADFSRVRIHTDASASESARAIDAQAYTVGRDIIFGSGHYAPESERGKRLLAHELTHVVQQTGAVGLSVQRKIEVNPGLTLDTMGYTVSKTGNVYTCPAIVKSSIWHELLTSLLFSPRVFKLKGTTNAQINRNLKKHIEARFGILEFASKKRYTFGAGSAFRMNPDYWIVDSSGWSLKPGVDRREAINDLNVHPSKYSIACLAATLLTMEGGSRSSTVDDYGVGADDWIPGDWGYITNTYFPSGGTPGLEGENIIYTGKDKFWGHFAPGNTYKTLIEWFNDVESWHGGANIEDFRTRPDAGLE